VESFDPDITAYYDRGEEARRLGIRETGGGSRCTALRLLLTLDAVPDGLDVVGRHVARLAEDVRVAPNELARDRLDHVAKCEGAAFLGHAGVEHDLKQEVAQLFLEVDEVAALDRVHDLIGFLEGVGRDGAKILLQVPRASGLGLTECRHDLDEALDIVGRGHVVHREETS